MEFFIQGFILQAGLILALGAQNIFVLESGLKKQHPFLVASICTLCDLILILIGVAGAGSVFVRFPNLKIFFGAIGVLFLFYYGVKKLKDAFQPASSAVSRSTKSISRSQALMLTLGFSLLNPHVYLDTFILVGGYSAQFPELSQRLEFGLGAGTLSAIWFFGLVLFASSLSPLLNKSKSLKVISFASGAILLFLSLKLGLELLSWI